MRERVFFITITLLIFCHSICLGMVNLDILSSTKIVRGTGEPVTEVFSFSSEFGGPAKIILTNGSLADSSIERVSSSLISVNGQIVFSPEEFNQNVSSLEKELILERGLNTMEVLLKGKPGGVITLFISQTISNVRIEPDQITLQYSGDDSQLRVLGNLSDSTEVDLTGSKFGTSYISSDTNVVTVSTEGLVTGVAFGRTSVVVSNGSFLADVPAAVTGSPPAITNLALLHDSFPVPSEEEHFTQIIAFDYFDPDIDIVSLNTTVIYPDGSFQNYAFNFEPTEIEGQSINELNVDSTYIAGLYELTIWIEDKQGNSASDTIFFSISEMAEAPVEITEIEPTNGKAGDMLLIKGKGFNTDPASNAVYFERCISNAIVSTASETELEVIVPEGAITGPIVLETGGSRVESPVPFEVQQDITLIPESARLITGQTVDFLCVPSGTVTPVVDWTLNGAAEPDPSLGTIDKTLGNCTYTAPENIPPLNPVTLRCFSNDDPELYAEVQIEIIEPLPPLGEADIDVDIGGEVQSASGDAKIVVPANALSVDTHITLETINAGDLPPVTENAFNLGAINLEPSGIHFSAPVTITIPLTTWVKPGTTLPLYLFDDEGGTFSDTGKTVTVDNTGLSASGEVDHFSKYATGLVPIVSPVFSDSFDGFMQDSYIIETPPDITFTEGLTVPVLIKRFSGAGDGIGPFTTGVKARAVADDGTTIPIKLIQPSADSWELGLVMDIPVLPSCYGETKTAQGQTMPATIQIYYEESTAKEFDFTIECLSELHFGIGMLPSDPAFNYLPPGAQVREILWPYRIEVVLEPYRQYRFSEITIGSGGFLHLDQTKLNTPNVPTVVEVTNDVSIYGGISLYGENGSSGENGSGADDSGYGGAGGDSYGGGGGKGGPYRYYRNDCMAMCGQSECYRTTAIGYIKFCPAYYISKNGHAGYNAQYGKGGVGGAGGLLWEKGSWPAFIKDAAKTVYDGVRIVASLGSDATAYVDLILDAYGTYQEGVKIYNNEKNELKSAGRGGQGSSAFPWNEQDYEIAGFTNSRAGGGGGGSGKMEIKLSPDASGGGGGGAGGAAPALKLVVGGNVFIGKNAIINGKGGTGGQGGEGYGTWGNQAAAAGGGGGGDGAQIVIIARSIINNGTITTQAGTGGLSGGIDGDGEILLTLSGFGSHGKNGILRVNGDYKGNSPVKTNFYKGPRLLMGTSRFALVSQSNSQWCTQTFFGNFADLRSLYPAYYYASTEYSQSEYLKWPGSNPTWQLCYPLNKSFNAFSLKVNRDSQYLTTGDKGPYVELHPWERAYVFYFPGAEDSDQDGIQDGIEEHIGTDPHNPDTDGDGLTDGDEINIYETDPLNPDTDGDGISDLDEFTFYRDADGDGYGNPDIKKVSKTQPTGYSTNKTDCNDSNASIYPGAAEACNALDDDCDSSIDETLIRQVTCGIGACRFNTGIETCLSGVWENNTCDPMAGASDEVCDGIDNDCDGVIDENLTRDTTCGVGICEGNTGFENCIAGLWKNNTCNPFEGAMPEACNGIDDDCNGTIPSSEGDDNGDGLLDCFGRVNTYTDGLQVSAAVGMNGNGNFVIIWTSEDQDGSGSGVYAQRYDNAGNSVGSEFRANTYTEDDQFHGSIAMDANGNFVVVWNSRGQDGSGLGVYAQRYDSNGVPVGSEFRVNTLTTDMQSMPSIGMDADGNFAIAWESDMVDVNGIYDGIRAQRYDSNGVPVGSEFRVNTQTTEFTQWPTTAMDTNGNFVIAWMSRGQDGSGYGVYAQRYDSNGVPLGSEFRVNTYTTDDQMNPSASMDADGNFVIAWLSHEQDGSAWGIYAQQYDKNGNAVGSEFRVYSSLVGNYTSISTAMATNGNFVISWYGPGSGSDVYARQYDSNGVPVGSEFRVNDHIENNQAGPSVGMDANGNFVIAWENCWSSCYEDIDILMKRYIVCVDKDQDGFGECPGCGQEVGCMFGGDDCNDDVNTIHPDAIEQCDGADDDCDGMIDEDCIP